MVKYTRSSARIVRALALLTICSIPNYATAMVVLEPEAELLFECLESQKDQALDLLRAEPELVHAVDGDLNTPLHHGARFGDIEFVRLCLDLGADVNAKNYQKDTALHLAVPHAREDLLRLLMEHGADIEAQNENLNTPLLIAAREVHFDIKIARLLIDSGADVNAATSWGATPLQRAALYFPGEFTDLLLENNAKFPEDPNDLWSLAYRAAMGGNNTIFQKITTELLADHPLGTNSRYSFLKAASNGGSPEIIKSLLDTGLDVNVRLQQGVHYVHIAANNGHVEAIRMLLEAGADINARDGLGQTVYNIAESNNDEPLIKMLKGRGCSTEPQAFPVFESKYIDPVLPGNGAIPFAMTVTSNRGSDESLHSTPVFSPDLTDMFWTLKFGGPILNMRYSDGKWTAPVVAAFQSEFGDGEPIFSHDGNRVYFLSTRPLHDTDPAEDENIWYSDRSDHGWEIAKPVSDSINDYQIHWQFCIDQDDTLFVSSSRGGGLGGADIWAATQIDDSGNHSELVNLDAPVNSPNYEGMPFVARDGSYLLFVRRGDEESFGGMDIYVSFRQQDETWGDPVNLGQSVNSAGGEICPIVTPDGKFLLFLRGSTVFWASADVIENARPD